MKSIRDRFDDGAMLFDSPSFDRSTIGVDAQSGRAIYDYRKMVEEFAEDNSCDEYAEDDDFKEFVAERKIT